MRPLVVDVRLPTTDRPQQMAQWSAIDDLWSVTHLSLEYQHVFDLCAVQAYHVGEDQLSHHGMNYHQMNRKVLKVSPRQRGLR